MADDVTFQTTVATPPSGTKVATDDVGGVHYQKVKLDLGGDGASDPAVGTVPISGTVTIDDSTPIDVDVASIAAGDNNIGNVDIVTVPSPLSTAGNGTAAAAHRVTIASDSTGTVAATQSGTWNVTNVSGTVSLPTGASTLAEQQTQTTALQLIDDIVYTDDTSTHATGTSKGALLMAAAAPTDASVNANDIGAVAMTTDRKLHVSVQDALPAGSANIGDVDVLTVPSPLSTAGNGTAATAHRVTIASDSTGQVTLAAGSAAIGKLAANSGVDIGDVDVTSLPNVTLAAGTNTNEVVGDVAHSAGVAGNPVLISGVSQDSDDTAPPNRVDAESDTTRLATDRDGSLFVRPHGPQSWVYHLDTSSAQTDATVHAAPGSGLSLYVGTIVFSSGAATAINLFFEEGSTKVMGPYYLEAVAGRGMVVQFNPPRKITANTALTLTTSAAIAHSVDITGFTAQG